MNTHHQVNNKRYGNENTTCQKYNYTENTGVVQQQTNILISAIFHQNEQ